MWLKNHNSVAADVNRNKFYFIYSANTISSRIVGTVCKDEEQKASLFITVYNKSVQFAVFMCAMFAVGILVFLC